MVGIAHCRIGVGYGLGPIELDRPKSLAIGKIHLHIGQGVGLIGQHKGTGETESERIARVFGIVHRFGQTACEEFVGTHGQSGQTVWIRMIAVQPIGPIQPEGIRHGHMGHEQTVKIQIAAIDRTGHDPIKIQMHGRYGDLITPAGNTVALIDDPSAGDQQGIGRTGMHFIVQTQPGSLIHQRSGNTSGKVIRGSLVLGRRVPKPVGVQTKTP